MTRSSSLRRKSGVLLLLLGWIGIAGLAGCLPDRVVIDFAPGEGELEEKPVLADEGAESRKSPKVALIGIDGFISQSPEYGLFSDGVNSIDRLAARLHKAEIDPHVRAVVLRVNSPGGSVAASETMYQEIRRFRERSGKPVVVSMGEVAASGGYYVSLASDHIVAQPTSITGSIGVIIQTVNFSRGMQKIGIEARAIKSGEMKDLANPLEPMREDQYELLQGTVDEFHSAFVDVVVERRGSSLNGADLRSLTDGRIFTGAAALRSGLVDENGGIREAFERAKELAELDRAKLVKYHIEGREPFSPYASSAIEPPRSSHAAEINLVQLNMPNGLFPRAGFYYLWTPIAP